MDIPQLTKADWDRISAAAEKLSGDPGFRYDAERMIDDDSLIFTSETVASIDKARLNAWHEPGRRREDEHAVYIRNARPIRDRPRCGLAIVDFRTVRAIIQI